MFALTLMFVLVNLIGLQTCDVVNTTTRYNEFESFFGSIIAQILRGELSPGIIPIDPLYINYFEGNLPTLKYRNYNSTVYGLKDCLPNNLKRSHDGTSMLFFFNCPRFVLYSSNDVTGHLFHKEMFGRGNLEIVYENFVIHMYAQIKYIKDVQGRVYYEIGPYSLDVDAIGPVTFNFMHLYNGDRAKNDEINQIANTNWKLAAYYSKEIVFHAIVDEIVKNMNHYLRTIFIINN